jgi:hypothetical protein
MNFKEKILIISNNHHFLTFLEDKLSDTYTNLSNVKQYDFGKYLLHLPILKHGHGFSYDVLNFIKHVNPFYFHKILFFVDNILNFEEPIGIINNKVLDKIEEKNSPQFYVFELKGINNDYVPRPYCCWRENYNLSNIKVKKCNKKFDNNFSLDEYLDNKITTRKMIRDSNNDESLNKEYVSIEPSAPQMPLAVAYEIQE